LSRLYLDKVERGQSVRVSLPVPGYLILGWGGLFVGVSAAIYQ
jgi:hypothetical protein